MKNVTLSVVVLSYNNSQYVVDCLDSIKNQGLNSYEVIVVDDGSTDGSPEIIKKYTEENPEFTAIYKENEGGAIASSVGLEKCTGKYCAIVDGDDMVAPGAYHRMIAFADEHAVDFVIGRPLRLLESIRLNMLSDTDENGLFVEDKILITNAERAKASQQVFYWNGIYRRDFLEDNAIRMPAHLLIADRIFLYKAIIRAKRIGIIPDIVYYWRRKMNDDKLSLMDQKNEDKLIRDRFESFEAQRILFESEINKKNAELIYMMEGNSIKRLFYPVYDVVLDEEDENNTVFEKYEKYICEQWDYYRKMLYNVHVSKEIKRIIKGLKAGNRAQVYKTIARKIEKNDNRFHRRRNNIEYEGLRIKEDRIELQMYDKQNSIVCAKAMKRLFYHIDEELTAIEEKNYDISDLACGTYLLYFEAYNRKEGRTLKKAINSKYSKTLKSIEVSHKGRIYRLLPMASILEVFRENRFFLSQIDNRYYIRPNFKNDIEEMFFYNGKNNSKKSLHYDGTCYEIDLERLESGVNTLMYRDSNGSYNYVRPIEFENKAKLEDAENIINKKRIEVIYE